MGWFSRNKDRDSAAGAGMGESTGQGAPEYGDAIVEEITATSPGQAELDLITAGVRRAASLGADPDDLASISAAYDTLRATQDAGAEVATEDIAAIGFAIGEFLSRNGYRWAMVSDTFGTDLGVEARRGSGTTIPHTLVATRWMRGERGWVERVIGHLVRLAGR